jgi:DNA-binding YbaB/EbfC family protein
MNPMEMLKKAQQLQAKMAQAQQRLKTLTATGTAGGDMVQIEITGEFVVTNVTMSPEAIDPNDLEMTEDLVLAAMSDALFKIKALIQQEMATATGGSVPPWLTGKA